MKRSKRRLFDHRALGGVVACSAVAAGAVIGLVHQPGRSVTDVESESGTVWLSGERAGRIVLAVPGSPTASFSVRISDPAAPLDLADIGRVVLVHDRRVGEIDVVDAHTGAVLQTAPAPVLDDAARPALVRAGSSAYVVDAATQTATRFTADGTQEPAVEVAGASEWVGTTDGTLWMLAGGGRVARVSRGVVSWIDLSSPDAAGGLTAVGADVVVFDIAARQVRWLARSTSVEVPAGWDGLQLQQPAAEGDCVGIVADDRVGCLAPDGDLRELQLSTSAPAGTSLFVTGDAVALVVPGIPDVVVGSFASGTSHTAVRSSPSSRSPVAAPTAGRLLIDDPGSRYAFEVVGTVIAEIDKLDARLLSDDGLAGGDSDGGADVAQGGPIVRDEDSANEPPEPVDDVITTRAGRTTAVAVLANDLDPDGDVLAVASATGPAPIEATVVLAEAVQIAVPDGVIDPFDVSYTVVDPGNLSASASVHVTIAPPGTNTDPTPAGDFATTRAGRAVDIAVLANDTDPESDPLTVVELRKPTRGTALVDSTGLVRYEPAVGFVGTDTFEYEVADGLGGSATAEVTVIVTPSSTPNQAPVAVDDRASATAGTTVTVAVLANDSDPDGDALRIATISNVPGMAVSALPDGSVVVAPGEDVGGPQLITYTIEDTAGARATARLLVLVTSPTSNRPPDASDDVFTNAAIVVEFDLLANDVDPDGDPLVLQSVSQPSEGGTVRVIGASSIRFEPTAGFTGRVSFDYVVSDPSGATDTAVVSVEVLLDAEEGGPVARDDQVTVDPGEAAIIHPLANDTHTTNEPIAIANVPTARSGRVELRNSDTVLFEPPSLEPETYVLDYTIRDADNRRSSAQIIVEVREISDTNRPPTPLDDVGTTAFEQSTFVDVLGNDTDPDGDTLALSSVSAPATGSAVIDRGRIRFTPGSGFSGVASFTYTVRDPEGLTASASVAVLVGERGQSPPTTSADLVTLKAGASTTIDPRLNDSDPDGSVAGLTIVSINAAQGSATHDASSVRINAPNAAATYAVTYVVSDADGLTASGTITVVVTAVDNSPPVAAADVAMTDFETPVVIAVLANDSDPDGGGLRITAVTTVSAAAGTAAITGSGAAILFTPATGYTGSAEFSYTVSDDAGLSATARVTVTVQTCASTAPVLADDSAFTPGGTPVTIDLYANDSSPEGVFAVTGSPDGTVTTSSGTPGVVTFTPAIAFSGTTSFGYAVTSTCGTRASAVVTVRVNRPPRAIADSATTGYRTPVTITVLANDVDPDGDDLTVVAAGAAVQGTVEVIDDSEVRFSPATSDTAFVGSFTYTIEDPFGARSSASVDVAVAGRPNDPPVAQNDTAAVVSGSSVVTNVLANDTDPDGDPLAIVSLGAVSPGSAGAANQSGGSITFTADDNFSGIATVRYTISDGRGGTDSATLSILVIAANRPPVAQNDSASTTAGDSVAVNVLANDSDPDGDPLTITGIGGPSPGGSGSASFSGGTITFTAAGGFSGTATVAYTISDGQGGTDSAALQVSVTSANQPPVAQNDSASTTAGDSVAVNVLANDSDPDGDPLTITGIGGPSPGGSGSASFSGGTITFTAAGGFSGTATVAYTISDGQGGTDSAALQVSVTSANQPPVAQNDSASTTAGDSVAVNVLANDSDPDGDPLTITGIGGPSPGGSGSASFSGGTITFTAAGGFSGTATVAYTISDGQGGTDSAALQVSVTSANQPPDAQDDGASTLAGDSVAVNVLANDSDPDGDPLTITGIGGPSPGGSGSASFSGGTITFTAAGGFSGTATVAYTISDGQGGTDSAALQVSVTIPNQPPDAQDDGASTLAGDSVAVNVLANDSDPDGDPLTITGIGGPSPGGSGSASFSGGTITFTAAGGFSGTATVAYTISDGQGGTDSAALQVSVTIPNRPPDAQDDSVTVLTGDQVDIFPLGNDSDPDGDPLTIIAAAVTSGPGSVTHGATSVTYSAGGVITPEVAQISYTISDGQGGTATATITVTILLGIP